MTFGQLIRSAVRGSLLSTSVGVDPPAFRAFAPDRCLLSTCGTGRRPGDEYLTVAGCGVAVSATVLPVDLGLPAVVRGTGEGLISRPSLRHHVTAVGVAVSGLRSPVPLIRLL